MSVHRVDRVDLTLDPEPLVYEVENRAAIQRAWQGFRAANPALYDGPVLLISQWSVAGGVLTGTCHRTRFSSVLFLRDHWAEGTMVWNGFGAGILRGCDGRFVLGEMGPTTANPGRVYFPGGIFDDADIVGGRVDPDRCIARELKEETGLTTADVHVQHGYIIVHHRHALGFGRICLSDLPASALAKQIRSTIADQRDAELVDMHVASGASDLPQGCSPLFTHEMLEAARAA